jgi:Glycosyltransferase sugar-binding region containing DXD motif
MAEYGETMNLSVCCLTDAPGPRIRAMLEPLRDVADEIVIAADQRVDPADVAVYEAVADRVLRCEFEFLEAHLAWLHGECSGDWILRLDGDEQASPELIGVLPELIGVADIRQYWFPRRWLDPSGRGWLDELPWAPDYQNRLVRNEPGLTFAGVLHSRADAAFPAQYRPEPIYHLLCQLETREERLVHSLFYEIQGPNRVAPGGGPFNATYYLPERFARRAPQPLSKGPSARAARSMHLVEPDLRMYQGETRELFVEVRNDSDLDWPGGTEEPLVRLSYRWREDPVDRDRTPLPAALPRGASAIAPVTVTAPEEPGRYGLQLDLVHEHVRWLEAGIDATVEIVPRGPTRRNVPGRLRRLLERQRIPRVFHRIWLGPDAMPEAERRFGETWARHHPDWEHRLWRDDDLAEVGVPVEIVARAKSPVELSDVARFHILARHGGVYVDTDFECLRPLDPLLKGVDAFASFQRPGEVAIGVLGATAGHSAFRRAAELVTETFGRAPLPAATGPPFFTHLMWDFPEVTLFPPELFYPYLWSEPERQDERFPQAYAVHHWAMSWREAAPTGGS